MEDNTGEKILSNTGNLTASGEAFMEQGEALAANGEGPAEQGEAVSATGEGPAENGEGSAENEEGLTNEGEQPEKKKFVVKALNPMMFLVVIVILCAVASYIVPAGVYDRVADAATGRQIVNPDSFHYIARTPVSLFTVLMSVTRGMQNAAYVIFFLLIIGGTFAVLDDTGAMNAGMANVVKATRGKELLMIPICMTVFGCGSAFCGNFEEFLAFIPLVLACCLTMGFDSLTAVGMVFFAAAAGYGGAITNAFTIGVAQSIAGLPMFSGIQLRVVLFIVVEAVTIAYVMWHANKVKKNPKSSSVYEYDRLHAHEHVLDIDNIPKMTLRQKLVLIVFVLGIAFTVHGVIVDGYYIDQLSGVFLAIGILAGIVGGMRPGKICDSFEKGFGNMLFPCIMIGLANAAIVILQDSNIMDTIVHALAGTLTHLPSSVMACGMFVVQDLFNFLVPSGSGQAAITMPIMAPLADMIGLTRQTAVLAFQLGDAFMNDLAPTGGIILAALAMCKIPYGKWIKYLLPLYAMWCVISCVFLIYATKISYGPF